MLMSRLLSPAFAQVIHNVNRSHHEATVKCEATNDIGFSEAELELDVKCE